MMNMSMLLTYLPPPLKPTYCTAVEQFYPKMLGRNPFLYRYFNETNQRSKKQAGAFASFISGTGPEEKGLMGEKCPINVGTPGVHDGLSDSCPSQQSKTLADGKLHT